MVDILLAFSLSFSWMKLLYVDSYFTEVCSWGFNWQYVIISSENRVSPSRRQAFTWTNDHHVLWCYMASLGHSELAWLGADESWMDVNVNTGSECIHWRIPKRRIHDDVIKWKHFPRYWPFVRGLHRSPVNSPHKGQWRGTLMFSLIFAWINGWVNNREAGDLRRHRAHDDVTLM